MELGKYWNVLYAYIRQGIDVDNKKHLTVAIVYWLSSPILRLKVVTAYIVDCKLWYSELKP